MTKLNRIMFVFVVVVGLLVTAVPHGARAREVAKAIPAERTTLLKGYFESIKGLKFEYRRVGSVLEAIAFVALSKEVEPDGKRIVYGVNYFDAAGRTLGELDLVVIDKENAEALAVYEVKLSGNPESALKIGKNQLARFRKHLNEGVIARMETEFQQGIHLEAKNFGGCNEFVMIGSRGTVQAGFDREFDLARDEFDLLQGWLLQRQPAP